jgi:hypothetical protein
MFFYPSWLSPGKDEVNTRRIVERRFQLKRRRVNSYLRAQITTDPKSLEEDACERYDTAHFFVSR